MKLASKILCITNEGREDRYMQMFNPVLRILGERFRHRARRIGNKFRGDVKEAISSLVREDRIIWVLRYAALYRSLEAMFPSDEKESPESEYIDGERRRAFHMYESDPEYSELKQLVTDLSEQLGQVGILEDLESPYRSYFAGRNMSRWSSLINTLKHYISLPIPEIQDYRFNRQSKDEVYLYFQGAETRWKSSNSNIINNREETAQHDVETLISFPDGWKWVLKNTPHCSIEGKAMGHCGNKGDPKPGDRILSLREPADRPGFSKPHCTFILNRNGSLGEMKGRGNQKPGERLHPYIVELLKNPIIQGIAGGGYLPGNNFSLEDLGGYLLADLRDARPDLVGDR